jgi:hypothetical protein
MLLLCVATVALASRHGLYHWSMGIGAVVFMAANALGAVYPLYRFRGRNPFNIYIIGMLTRLGLIGALLTVLITRPGLSKETLLALTLTGMASFVAYLAVEIRHFLRNETFQAR